MLGMDVDYDSGVSACALHSRSVSQPRLGGCLGWVSPPIRGSSNRWVRVNCYHDMAVKMFMRSALLNDGERRCDDECLDDMSEI